MDSDENVPEANFRDVLTFDADGRMELNGKEVMENPPTSFIFADVEKIHPSTNGSIVFQLKPFELRSVGKNGQRQRTPINGESKSFRYHEKWKMYDSEGNETPEPEIAMRVLMPNPTDADDVTAEVKWNECDSALPGNYLGLSCNQGRFMDDVFVGFLKENLLKCVNAGVAKVGGQPAVKTYILHDGTSPDGAHDKNSLHAAGRAVDLLVVSAVDANGQKRDFDFRATSPSHKTTPSCVPANTDNCKFWEGFRRCWGNIHTARNCPLRPAGQPTGSLGWEDKKHVAHHLHTSMPFCPKSNGFKTTQAK